MSSNEKIVGIICVIVYYLMNLYMMDYYFDGSILLYVDIIYTVIYVVLVSMTMYFYTDTDEEEHL